MSLKKQTKSQISIVLFFLLFIMGNLSAQTAIWVEDFDDGGGTRWVLENAPGSKTNPTPAGIVGLTYGTNDPIRHDNFVINDRNTPELDNDIAVGVNITSQGQFVRGRHYACSAPSNLPNPFVNGAQPGPNQSLHITAYSTCATLLYGGTPQQDDWNCISDPNNGDPQTLSEQYAYLNQNINASGKCNLVFTADFFLGGDSDGIKSHGTILYSVDAGVTWKVLKDSLSSCSPFLAGTCNNWFRRSFAIPADANNQADLRIAFRWYDDGDIENTGDYALGASFNVDNLIITACDAPTPDFTASMFTGCKGETFQMTDLSTTSDGLYTNCFSILGSTCPITSWTWDFDKPGPPGGFVYVNGTTANSQNPQVQFTSNGVYDVILTVTNCGGSNTLTLPGYIVIADCPPTANFIGSHTTVCAMPAIEQDVVLFTDLSTTPSVPITSWSWSFSPGTVTYVGGTNANSQNPMVVFDAIGSYQVQLTVTSAEGSDSYTQSVLIEAIDCNCGGGGGGGPVTVFQEDFDGNGGAGSNWAVVNSPIGAQGDIPNQWYISSAEAGNAPGSCGTAGGADKSLHVSSCPCWAGDLGAAYEIGAGFCGILAGFCPITDKRSYSVNINTVGVTGMTLQFNYIENGQGATDNAIVEYSINGGASWITLVDPPKPGVCGNGQGLWTAFSIPLPAACENIANLRIGFRWWNNDDGVGVDPSFAVDDIVIIGTGGGGGSANTWEGDVSNDWNTAANWSNNAVPTSADDALVPATICGTCVMPQISTSAFVRDLCNFGTITMVSDNTLTIDRDCLNEGEITTTTVNPAADMIFANTVSTYKGSGTLYDVDLSTASSDLSILTNIWPRSFRITTSGTVNLGTYVLAVNRDITKTSGTFTAVNGTILFTDACPTCLDQTNTSDVTLNANQIFGNIIVNKPSGLKASWMSPAVNYTVNTPKTVTIMSGVLDANTSTFNGTGNVTMTGGELHIAKCATIVPELTGIYTLSAGTVQFDGVCGQIVKNTTTLGTNYFKVEFTGSGIKSLNGNTRVADSLIFALPTTLGNYVNAGTDTLFVLNNNAGIVSHFGGHVVGEYNRAITPSGGVYVYHVGSTNADNETYFEPIRLTPTGLNGTNSVTARFFDLTPNPTAVIPGIVYGLPPNIDTLEQVETEGYWRMNPYTPIVSGTYEANVSPDVNYWTFAWPWGQDYHSLLKQEIEGDSWDYTAGGIRVDDSTTTNFSDFSNYALAYAKNGPLTPLAASLVAYNAVCDGDQVYLNWTTATEINTHSFLIERSSDGSHYETIGVIPAAGNSQSLITYSYRDSDRNGSKFYYRLIELDLEGVFTDMGTIFTDCDEAHNDLEIIIYPNPTQGDINISILSTIPGVVDLSIVDMTGKTLLFESGAVIHPGGNFKSYQPQLSPGVYFVSLNNGGKTITERFVVID